jgi:PAT family beta-lactamase induction signal transducer AmpG
MNLPIDYMEFIDARGYEWRGITGAFVTDALISGSACVLLAGVFRRRLLPARRAAGVARE